jgi:phospholipid-binding lipoprotein MlaA
VATIKRTSVPAAMKVVQAALVATAVILGGCASVSDPRDPYEPFNRGVYRFNDGLDKAVVQPAARAYRAVLPSFVRASVGNVFSNVGDVRNVLNNGLQGKLGAAYADLGRVFINSTLGLAGLFDIASEAGIEKHNEDFGQTLGAWGARSGSFLVLPILGSTSTRDALGSVVDYATNPMTFVDPTGTQLALRGAEGIGVREQLLEAGAVLEKSVLDPYLFIRDAYFQRRGALVRDGRPAPAADGLDLVERTQ